MSVRWSGPVATLVRASPRPALTRVPQGNKDEYDLAEFAAYDDDGA